MENQIDMKKTIFIILFLLAGSLYSQALNSKWINVLDRPDQKVYIDTTTIKKFENQISVLSITYFTDAQKIDGVTEDVYIIKSQLLFNLALQKYSSIGNLFYNKNLKILGESSLPGFSSNGDNFSLAIDSNPSVYAIYNFCLNLIGNDSKFRVNRSSSSQKPITAAETIFSESDRVLPVENEVKVVDIPTDKKEDAFTKLTEKKKEAENSSTESNPKSTIFLDGSKYSFQVSSWKNKAKAESEMNRLKRNGHNAFIASAYIPERKGTWYRVRIGYFNSIEETEEYMKKLK